MDVQTELAIQTQKDELIASFCNWLYLHLDPSALHFLNILLDQIDDDQILEVAEKWASTHKKSKIHY